MGLFGRKAQSPQTVTNGRFEIERDGDIAYLEYNLAGKVLELIHTEVPPKLRGAGLASLLAKNALQWARDHKVKVDIICPTVLEYIGKHPEYSDLILR